VADRRLQVFHAVARHLSFTKAGEALHMTQPAVTFQIKQLEERFNTRLFERGGGRISLTRPAILSSIMRSASSGCRANSISGSPK
jgi:DNA-binding transcriptional LysR family regulator